MKDKKKRIEECILIGIILFLCEWAFFRDYVGTQNKYLIGGLGDGRFTALVAEHWWKFFQGKEAFNELPIYHPFADVIGFSDMLFGYGIVHSILRFFGVDMLQAYKWTLIIFHAFGAGSMYYLLRKTLKCQKMWALFGTIAFCFSNAYAIHINHTQLNAVCFLPLLLILFIGFIRNFENRKKRNRYAYPFLLWFVLLTYNSWYIACFTGVFCLLFLIFYLIVLKCNHIKLVPLLWSKFKKIWKDAIFYLVFLMILFIPFISIYLPIYKLSSGYSYWNCACYLIEPVDIINVSDKNLMLGWFMKLLRLPMRGFTMEICVGFSIVLLIPFVVTYVKLRKDKSCFEVKTNKQNSSLYTRALLITGYLTVMICILLVIRLSSSGLSFWMIIYYLIPVTRSMRAVSRFLFWLSFPMAVLTTFLLNKYYPLKTKKNYLYCTYIIILLANSNINLQGVVENWNVVDEYDFVSNVATPPEDAEVFYMIDTAYSGRNCYIDQLDAYEIATWYSLKTVNGYSGQDPPYWGLGDICASNYEVNVYNWVQNHQLQNVYAYDRATNTWIPFEVRMRNLGL